MRLWNQKNWVWQVVRCAGCLLVLFFATDDLWAQSLPARTRRAEITAFGMHSTANPDYGIEPNVGFTAGGDFTRLFKFTSLSLEFRYKNTVGANVGERTIGGGPRFEYRWTRLHLYADLLGNGGKITFANKNARGSFGTGYNGSVVYSYGAGADLDLNGQWATRFDYQGEHWDLQEKPKILFFPNTFSVGIVYRLRFIGDRSRW